MGNKNDKILIGSAFLVQTFLLSLPFVFESLGPGAEEETSLSIVYTLLLVACSCNMLYLLNKVEK